MDCSPPGSSVHGILQTRILEWVAVSTSKGSSPPRDWTHVYCISQISQIAGRFFATEPPGLLSTLIQNKKLKKKKVTVCFPLCWGHSGGQKTVLGLQESMNLQSRWPSHGQIQHKVMSPINGQGVAGVRRLLEHVDGTSNWVLRDQGRLCRKTTDSLWAWISSCKTVKIHVKMTFTNSLRENVLVLSSSNNSNKNARITCYKLLQVRTKDASLCFSWGRGGRLEESCSGKLALLCSPHLNPLAEPRNLPLLGQRGGFHASLSDLLGRPTTVNVTEESDWWGSNSAYTNHFAL